MRKLIINDLINVIFDILSYLVFFNKYVGTIYYYGLITGLFTMMLLNDLKNITFL